MTAKNLQRRIEKLEADRFGGLVLRWAETAEEAARIEAEAREANPFARIIVLRWQS